MVTKYIKNDNRAVPEYDKHKTYIDSNLKVPSGAIIDILQIKEDFVLKQLKDLDVKFRYYLFLY